MRSISQIKKKYGEDAFRKWGRQGGSPILKAYEEGRITIHSRPIKRKKR